ncbi:MAG: signal peptidase I [Myxococcales bacterium]|nr:signal peptidase I [Myxococcales bacterium]
MAATIPSELMASAGPRARTLRSVISAFWFLVVPALLAAVVMTRLVPETTADASGVLRDAVDAAHRYPLPLGVGLFLLFSAVARYWQFCLPGWAQVAMLPPSGGGLPVGQRRTFAEAAALRAALASKEMRTRLRRSLDEARRRELDEHLAALGVALEGRDVERARELASAARALAAAPLERARQRELVSLLLAIAAAALLAFAVRARVVESYGVLSGSMLPTLQPDDRLAGNRLAYRGWTGRPTGAVPRRGDIIVFQSSAVDGGALPEAPPYLVKRVIGLPGDRISMHGGIPIINGWKVPYCEAGEYLYVWRGGENGMDGRLVVEFLEDRAYLTVESLGLTAFNEVYEVKPGEVFVLGDNRNNSVDSRAYNDHHGGGVPLPAVEARVQWFVAGRDGKHHWDFTRLFKPIDSIALDLRLTGVDVGPIEAGIARCLVHRPSETRPPPPGAAAAAAAAATGPAGLAH